MAKLLFLTFCVVLAAVVFNSEQAAICACTIPTIGSDCATLKVHVTCLTGVTVANACTTEQVSTAKGLKTAADKAVKIYGCSGAGSLMTSAGLVLVLTSLAYLFNGKKI